MDTSHNINPMLYVGANTKKSYGSDIRKGTSRYQGTVLRAEPINSKTKEGSDDWWQKLFGVTSPPLPAYRIHVAEFHQSYLKPESYDMGDKASQVIIDSYPKFVAQSTSTEPAEVGALVWVAYGNIQTFENPIYLGPVQSSGNQNTSGANSSDPSPSSAGCGGGKSLQTPPATGQPNEPTSSEPTSSEPTSSSGEQVPKIPPPPSSPPNCLAGLVSGGTDQSAGVADKTLPYPLSKPKAKLVKVEMDSVRPQFNRGGKIKSEPSKAILREDVASDLSEAKRVINALGCVLPSAGGKRGLNVGRLKGRSFHPLGMAFDIHTGSNSLYAYRKNQWDVEFLLTPSNGGRNLDIWAQSTKPVGTTVEGFKVERKTLNVAVRRGRNEQQPPRFSPAPYQLEQYTANVIPITAILKAYGFDRIGVQKDFPSGGKVNPKSEWWHFQSTRQAIVNKTRWGELARLVHKDSEINNLTYNINRVFRGKTFT
jgi:hypothetical protein